jgi:hypothetical protein
MSALPYWTGVIISVCAVVVGIVFAVKAQLEGSDES